jgi:hypothetical protein
MSRRFPIPPCLHCGKPPGRSVRRRGLCSACYADLATRRLYPAQAVGRFAPGAAQEFFGPVKLPRSPTDAPPGSQSKLAVLAARAESSRALFHPADVILPPDAWGWSMEYQGVASGAVVRLQGTA